MVNKDYDEIYQTYPVFKHNPYIYLIVGESGTGKSHTAKKIVDESKGKTLRVNRDTLRSLIHNNSSHKNMEKIIKKMEEEIVKVALSAGKNICVDNTHLTEEAVTRWTNIAIENECNITIYRMNTPYETAIIRDSCREGSEYLGKAIIDNQFLRSGRLPIRQIETVIFDIDGTVCNGNGIRNIYDESRVIFDKPHQNIINMIKLYQDEGKQIIAVSGRTTKCGKDTFKWLYNRGIPPDFLLMREFYDKRHDVEVKQDILGGILKLLPKELIVRVYDDRPAVIVMWKKNNLPVQAVYQNEIVDELFTEHKETCEEVSCPIVGRCIHCGAIKDF